MVFLLLVSKLLPATSADLPLISRYLIFAFLSCVFTIFTSVASIAIGYRSPREHRVPLRVRRVLLDKRLVRALLLSVPRVLLDDDEEEEEKEEEESQSLGAEAEGTAAAVDGPDGDSANGLSEFEPAYGAGADGAQVIRPAQALAMLGALPGFTARPDLSPSSRPPSPHPLLLPQEASAAAPVPAPVAVAPAGGHRGVHAEEVEEAETEAEAEVEGVGGEAVERSHGEALGRELEHVLHEIELMLARARDRRHLQRVRFLLLCMCPIDPLPERNRAARDTPAVHRRRPSGSCSPQPSIARSSSASLLWPLSAHSESSSTLCKLLISHH